MEEMGGVLSLASAVLSHSFSLFLNLSPLIHFLTGKEGEIVGGLLSIFTHTHTYIYTYINKFKTVHFNAHTMIK